MEENKRQSAPRPRHRARRDGRAASGAAHRGRSGKGKGQGKNGGGPAPPGLLPIKTEVKTEECHADGLILQHHEEGVRTGVVLGDGAGQSTCGASLLRGCPLEKGACLVPSTVGSSDFLPPFTVYAASLGVVDIERVLVSGSGASTDGAALSPLNLDSTGVLSHVVVKSSSLRRYDSRGFNRAGGPPPPGIESTPEQVVLGCAPPQELRAPSTTFHLQDGQRLFRRPLGKKLHCDGARFRLCFACVAKECVSW